MSRRRGSACPGNSVHAGAGARDASGRAGNSARRPCRSARIQRECGTNGEQSPRPRFDRAEGTRTGGLLMAPAVEPTAAAKMASAEDATAEKFRSTQKYEDSVSVYFARKASRHLTPWFV